MRERKLPLPRLVAFLLNAPRSGLQSELDAFFDHALDTDASRPLTKSALCQARRQLQPAALRALLSHSADVFTAHTQAQPWHGRRVLAVDGTTLRVPKVPECASFFGGMHMATGGFRPLARASGLFDVARGAFVDALIGRYDEDERSLAREHLPHLGAGDLLLMDRGYPAREFFHALIRRGTDFCARISDASWSAVARFADSDLDDAVVDLGEAGAPLPLRLLRLDRPGGEPLILATTVLDHAVTRPEFEQLYRTRWCIEEGFKLIKARLQVENWSGLLPHTVEQDFYASLLRANCAAVIACEVRPEEACVVPDHGLDRLGWRQRLNRSRVIKSLRHFLPRILLGIAIDSVIDRLLERLRAPGAIERTRPDRHAVRRSGVRIADFHWAYKAA